MKKAKYIFVFLLLLLLLGGAFFYWFITEHSFSARVKPMALEAIIARNLRSLAIPPGVKDLNNPLEKTELLIAEARDHFADHCAVCHGNKGDGQSMINEGLYPPAPDMRTSVTQALTDGEIFYIIKNGIRFTGMPGWGGEDNENWALVHFIRHLPHLTFNEIKLMEEVNGLKGEEHGQ